MTTMGRSLRVVGAALIVACGGVTLFVAAKRRLNADRPGTSSFVRGEAVDQAFKRRVASGTRIRTQEEVVAIFVGASTCPASNQPEVAEAYQRAVRALSDRALQSGKRFSAVGIAVDWSVPDGLAFLRKSGPFDEVMVGRNWLSTGVTRYIWSDLPGPATLPQVILLSRTVESTEQGLRFTRERVLLRRVGADAIRDWTPSRATLAGA